MRTILLFLLLGGLAACNGSALGGCDDAATCTPDLGDLPDGGLSPTQWPDLTPPPSEPPPKLVP